jgi:hypothetical protein
MSIEVRRRVVTPGHLCHMRRTVASAVLPPPIVALKVMRFASTGRADLSRGRPIGGTCRCHSFRTCSAIGKPAWRESALHLAVDRLQ